MAYYGADSIIEIDQETEYGVITSFTAENQLSAKLTMSDVRERVSLTGKTASIFDKDYNVVEGSINPTATMDFDLSWEDYDWVWKLLLGATSLGSVASPTLSLINADTNSWQIRKYLSGESTQGAGDGIGQRLKGCKIKSLTVTGDINQPVKMTVEFRGQELIYEDDLGSLTQPSPKQVILFSDSDFSFTTPSISDPKISSFELKIDIDYADDRNLYAISSNKKYQDIAVRFNASITVKRPLISEGATSPDISLLREAYKDLTKTINCRLQLKKDGSSYYDLYVKGFIDSYELPDPDNDIFEESVTIKAASNDSSSGFSLAKVG